MPSENGMNLVTLANGKTFTCNDDKTLLEAAKLNNLVLEHSCRTGRCGACKAQVVSGKTVVLQNEEALTSEEISENIILTCCRAAASSLTLGIDDLGDLADIEIRTLPCRIDDKRMLAEDVIEITLRTPPNNPLKFLPGQYIDVIGSEGVRRSYSIANAPRADGKISLQIRKVPSGKMSEYWFEASQKNDLLRLEGPLGTFCLRETKASRLIMLATGTGIAPIRAILEQLSSSEDQPFDSIHVYWGGRTPNDIYWLPGFDNLPLRFAPVLSRIAKGDTKKGYVQDAVIGDGIALDDAVVYACGSDAMIHSAHSRLLAAGLAPKAFYSDAFVSSS